MAAPKIEQKIASYGKWTSPLTENDIANQSKSFADLLMLKNDLYWLENTPIGKKQIWQFKDGSCKAITDDQHHIGTQIMSYGGYAYSVNSKFVIFFDNKKHALYLQTPKGNYDCILQNVYYELSNFIYDDVRHCIFCIGEDHKNNKKVENFIAKINIANKSLEKIVAGDDFYSGLTLSPEKMKLSWVAWQQPNMPWDSTELFIAHLGKEGTCTKIKKIAGGENISIQQPKWKTEDLLFYISDQQKGWWNIFCFDSAENTHRNIYPIEAEFGQPPWISGMSTYCFDDQNNIYTMVTKNGTWFLVKLQIQSPKIHVISEAFADYGLHLYYAEKKLYFVAGYQDKPQKIIAFDIERKTSTTIRDASSKKYHESIFSQPKAIEFETSAGMHAHAFLYRPQNTLYQAPEDTLPPLFIKCHGGPTASTSTALNLKIQYWTSRGYMVADVNYRGSTSYGRDYREALYQSWGDSDVDDCIYLAKKLIAEKKVDPHKIIISGGSAGGYLVLRALIKSNIFSAAAVYYGLSDLVAIRQDGEKFEQNYDHFLIGPYDKEPEKYVEKSPIHHIDKITTPTIFFHGGQDKIVPKNQTEKIYEQYQNKDIKCQYHLYEGEGHGFRSADTIENALKNERQFYETVLNL